MLCDGSSHSSKSAFICTIELIYVCQVVIRSATIIATRSTHVYRSVISGLRCEFDEKCGLLGHYAASGGNLFLTFRENLSLPSSKTCPCRCEITQNSAVLMSNRVCRHNHVTFVIQGVKSQLISDGNWYQSKYYLT